jgi:hypothetical protein
MEKARGQLIAKMTFQRYLISKFVEKFHKEFELGWVRSNKFIGTGSYSPKSDKLKPIYYEFDIFLKVYKKEYRYGKINNLI